LYNTTEKGIARRHSYNGVPKKKNVLHANVDAVPIYEQDSDDSDVKKKHSTGSQAGDSGIGSFRRTVSSCSSVIDVNSSLQGQGKCQRRKRSTGDVVDSKQSSQSGNSVGKLKIRKLSAESFFEGYCNSKRIPDTEEFRSRKYSIESFLRGLLGNKTKISRSQTSNEIYTKKGDEIGTSECPKNKNCGILEQCHDNLGFEHDSNDLHKHDEAAVQEILNELHEMASDPKNMKCDVSQAELPSSLKDIFPRHRVLHKSDSGYGTTENLSIRSATTFL
jgi:hypothetical protein